MAAASVGASPVLDLHLLEAQQRDIARDIVARHIEVYFEYIYPWPGYHFSHRPSLLEDFHNGNIPSVLCRASRPAALGPVDSRDADDASATSRECMRRLMRRFFIRGKQHSGGIEELATLPERWMRISLPMPMNEYNFEHELACHVGTLSEDVENWSQMDWLYSDLYDPVSAEPVFLDDRIVEEFCDANVSFLDGLATIAPISATVQRDVNHMLNTKDVPESITRGQAPVTSKTKRTMILSQYNTLARSIAASNSSGSPEESRSPLDSSSFSRQSLKYFNQTLNHSEAAPSFVQAGTMGYKPDHPAHQQLPPQIHHKQQRYSLANAHPIGDAIAEGK
ncbi:hypothetical protein VTK73DRAFT_10030 [Phialemonium thermophilum]|uniref:Uncharacterized protein n=1 Tax=Phialemonium thermophilum TaxID=223376 RepID=A0ABR3XI72_9PEZI